MDNGDITVLVADSEAYYREFLQLTLQRAGLQVVGAAASGDELIEMARSRKPDVILLDANMTARNGFAILASLKRARPRSRVILLSGNSTPVQAAKALRLGACGWLSKRADVRKITSSLRKVADGETVVFASAGEASLAHPEDEAQGKSDAAIRYGNGLTVQERRVLQLVADGFSNNDIADFLAVSYNTVKTHLSSIYCKLGVSGRTQAAVWALRNGWAP